MSLARVLRLQLTSIKGQPHLMPAWLYGLQNCLLKVLLLVLQKEKEELTALVLQTNVPGHEDLEHELKLDEIHQLETGLLT